MAEGKVEGAGKKSALSSRIMQMKFMQRGKDKPVSQEAVAEQVAQASHAFLTSLLCKHHIRVLARLTWRISAAGQEGRRG